MQIANYDTDLTAPKSTGRPRTPLRRVVNAILYLIKSGCQWRLLPKTFPPWKTVNHIFRDWIQRNIWSAMNDRLRALVRQDEEKRSRPTAAILDSQTVR